MYVVDNYFLSQQPTPIMAVPIVYDFPSTS